MVLAAIGFILSVTAHVMALAGMPFPGGGLVWGLHIGIFVVWIPTVLVGNRMTRGANRKDFWKTGLAGCPLWMRRAVTVIFCYAIFNFILFLVSTAGQPKPKGAAPPSIVRGFSGHWMLFYGAAFATIYSAIHAPRLLREPKCPQGRAVAPTDRFCPKCGTALPESMETPRIPDKPSTMSP